MPQFNEQKACEYLEERFREHKAVGKMTPDIVTKLDEVGEDAVIDSLVCYGGMLRKRVLDGYRCMIHDDEVAPVIKAAWVAMKAKQRRLQLV